MAEDDIGQLKKRFDELANRAFTRGAAAYTRFLNTAEQSVLSSMRLAVEPRLCGGFPWAERRIAVFEPPEGTEDEPPIVCVRIAPVNARFSDELTHRDFLGALMACGVSRDTLGDILVKDGAGYLICLESVADFIAQNLTQVKHTTVTAVRTALPETAALDGETRSIVVASERLDAVIAAFWRIPREEAKLLCERGFVFVDSRVTIKAASQIPHGASVTVRGRGRFRYDGVDRETKKGRLRVLVTTPGS